MNAISKTDDEWRKALSPERYHILRMKGTEKAFTGDLLYNKDKGVYACGGCGAELFRSGEKFDSGSGWPSFFAPVSEESIEERPDRSLFTTRTEIVCARCGGHLGHVFEDGPAPTGRRYCVNSLSLDFKKDP
ncbi:MAG: peptide-methionine (R)-S-oxide reductase MsrB [Methanobacteriota archaeon]|nr:MAG: peptide-methionine (R)-S-oxide reductase MsrB [Euryarchaeota archaeon]